MEPRQFSRGYLEPLGLGRPLQGRASMEPRQFSRGYGQTPDDPLQRPGASMEPRQFSRGYSTHLEPLRHVASGAGFREGAEMPRNTFQKQENIST